MYRRQVIDSLSDRGPHISDSVPCIFFCEYPLYPDIPFHHHFQTEAGCRILVNAILLHVVSNLSSNGVDVCIVPEFRMEVTRFEYDATSYGGTVAFCQGAAFRYRFG